MSKKSVIVATEKNNPRTIFSITDTKLYAPVVTFSNQNNAKLLGQLKYGFKRTIKWNKYWSETSTERQNQYLDYLIDPSFQEVNRLFFSLLEDDYTKNKLQTISSSDCRNIKLCYDRWTKLFWSTSKK